jgi:hypothetical protein
MLQHRLLDELGLMNWNFRLARINCDVSVRPSLRTTRDERIWIKFSTRCGYQVGGIILMPDARGNVRLDRGKDMSVHASTCTIYGLNALTPVL